MRNSKRETREAGELSEVYTGESVGAEAFVTLPDGVVLRENQYEHVPPAVPKAKPIFAAVDSDSKATPDNLYHGNRPVVG